MIGIMSLEFYGILCICVFWIYLFSLGLLHTLVGLTTPFVPISSYTWSNCPLFLNPSASRSTCSKEVRHTIEPDIFLRRESKGPEGFLQADIQTKNIPAVAARPAAKDTLAYLIFSSGTTETSELSCHSRFRVCYNLHLTVPQLLPHLLRLPRLPPAPHARVPNNCDFLLGA
jgi:hypothetical protein